MLYPQLNSYRTSLPSPCLWTFKVDPKKVGEKEGWHRGFESDAEIAVPGSWNEQLEEVGLADYVGDAWYRTEVFIPQEWSQRAIFVRVGSADYCASVWLNGAAVGSHDGGFLPFEFDITSAAAIGAKNTIVIRVSNELSSQTIPQGITAEDYASEGRLREETYPPVRFDFFPYGGIHRPVVVHAVPRSHLAGILVDTSIPSPGTGVIRVRVSTAAERGMKVRCTIVGRDERAESDILPAGSATADLQMLMEQCRFWSPEDPYLYMLRVQLVDREVVDEYELPIGVRQVSVAGGKLLLNGKPVYLKGFGRHEDFPVLGKALSTPLVVKDFGLMNWIHANSFRTSHYPYAEEVMSMADREGFLVIDEVPAVSLDLRRADEKTLTAHRMAIKELIGRDHNHPSVIMWALGNEPNLVGEDGYLNGSGRSYWEKVFAYARSLDPTRPMTVPNCTRAGMADPVFEFSDVLTINRYYGWYEFPGRIAHAVEVLGREMDAIHARFRKPVLMSEFGADAIPGLHSISDQLFTEEYQQEFLRQYIALLRSKDYVVGEHVWNFADFKTSQHFRRVMLNMKGVFTRTRQPKAAAFLLRSLWASPPHVE